jgi:D-serine deaminase-like pyridoxal phosphate-dependent protein
MRGVVLAGWNDARMLLPDGLRTPALLVDLDRLEANVAGMAARAAEAGFALRPHAKTHKCLQVGQRQLAAGAAGLTVATVAEAEVFATICPDLFIAYPLWVDAERGARLRALRERVRLSVGVDSAEGAAALARQAGAGLDVLVEIDSGHHRTGVTPDRAGEVAAAAARAGLVVRGVFTFPGHSYAPGAGAPAAHDEAQALAAAAAALHAVGLDAVIRSGGSTPSIGHTAGGTVTEARPGVYVFGDTQQLELGAIGPDHLALVAVGTVVHRGPEKVVLDAGSKVLGADRPAWASGFGYLPAYPEAAVIGLSEHHATLRWPGELPELGSPVAVVPNHVCNAVNLADELLITRAGRVIEAWPVAARGANT